ncbi:MAG: ABC transporter substrate-binding protein, partial [Promethearchaeota archaeon]
MKKISILAVMTVLVLSSFVATPMASSATAPRAAKTQTDSLDYGVGSLVVDLDPHFAWDSASIDTIDQVCEGLFAYDLNDPELAIIPALASAMGTWNDDATEYTVTLRDGVTFHDGWAFNASAVAWNFARLQYLIDYKSSQVAELYEPLFGEAVVDKVIINDNLNITFKLNYAYVPFVPLLCFSSSYMISPNPASTPFADFLTAGEDTLVGTGPFMYDYTTTDETHLIRNENYWKGEAAIPSMHWIYYADDVTKQQAMLSGEVDCVDGIMASYLPQYEDDEHIIVYEKRRGTSIGYIGMNNEVINMTYRQAISYATNYTYILKNIYEDQVVRNESPVPEG